MKLILSEFEASAIIHCSELLNTERCIIAIVHESKKSAFAKNLCNEAFYIQKEFEIQRAYKDFRIDHIINYLAYPVEGYEQVLVAYLQIKHILGGYSQLVYPQKYEKICKSIKGNIELINYNELKNSVDNLYSQYKALRRFKTI